jgi:hypothetical protein
MFLTTPAFEVAMLFNEMVLSLRPTIVRSVGSDVSTQVLIHNLSFIVMSMLIAKPSEISGVFDTSVKNMFRHFGMGLLSFLIVSLTYFSYKELPLELSMSIVYSYPWILAGLSIILLKTQEYKYFIPMIITYIMLMYHLRPKPHHIERLKSLPPEKQNTKCLAVAAAVVGTLLIGLRFFIYKSGAENYVTGTLRTYMCTLFIVFIGFILNKQIPDLRPATWIKLVCFNISIAFISSQFKIAAMEELTPMYIGSFIFMGALIAYTISQKIPYFKAKVHEDFEERT